MDRVFWTSKYPMVGTVLSLLLLSVCFSPPLLEAADPLLKEIIVGRNQRLYGESLQNGSYRGEEGLLRIRPEAGQALGLTVLMDQDYLEGHEWFQRAERFLERAKTNMVSQRRDKSSQEYAQQILDSFLAYRKAFESGRQKLEAYRAKLNAENDERLIDARTSQILDRVLEESLKRTAYRLRDALALFYNECHDLRQNDYPLSTENVGFVNEVSRQFIFRASQDTLSLFKLDRQPDSSQWKASRGSRQVLDRLEAQYLELVHERLEGMDQKDQLVDPLLFLALMKRESSFDPQAVSRVGAAGLTQIMPQTALELGMKRIYKPGYFDTALSIMERERKARSEATAALYAIGAENGLAAATRARELMQQSLKAAQEKERLFARYRNELIQNRDDERFQPGPAIEYGLRYFSRLMAEFDGDISLALAAYNAGPHRVREYRGIPPFGETVLFRSKVLDFYREYRRKMGLAP